MGAPGDGRINGRAPGRDGFATGPGRFGLSIMAALLAILFAGLGGGNPSYVAEHDPDLAPAPYAFPATEMVAQIEATPTVAAIAPTVTAAAVSEGHGTGCPAIIVETFGAHADAACAVAWCESRWHPHAVGDGGNSLGLFQLWTGWAAWYGVPVEALYDPVTNTAVARAVLDYRGRWGGKGGWTCADLLGIS